MSARSVSPDHDADSKSRRRARQYDLARGDRSPDVQPDHGPQAPHSGGHEPRIGPVRPDGRRHRPVRADDLDVIRIIVLPDAGDIQQRVIVWEIRLPMALMAIVVGASLSVAGAEMQTILNNPLASPFTLGVSAAAGFGAAIALVLGVSILPFAGIFFVAGNAFVLALIAALLIYSCSMLRGVNAETMVLLGIALVFMFNALLALLQYVASEQALQQVVFWMLGSLTRADWPKVGLTAGVLLLCDAMLRTLGMAPHRLASR